MIKPTEYYLQQLYLVASEGSPTQEKYWTTSKEFKLNSLLQQEQKEFIGDSWENRTPISG